MDRDTALRIIAEHRAELDAQAVESISLFGSVARDEAGPESDVDLLVSFTRPVGLFHLSRLKRLLDGWLQAPVDLVTRNALRPQFRERVLGEAIDV